MTSDNSGNGITSGRGLRIFADNCEMYWNAGLPVMPLKMFTRDGGDIGKDGKPKPTGKEPVMRQWATLQGRMPDEAERASWIRQYADGNIGLPLGVQSKLIAIDVDTTDPKLLALLDAVLPPSPWTRIGQKGYVKLYRNDGQRIIRLKYKDENGASQSLIEMLGGGSQIVLPPSIHPKTEKPYTENCRLVDVLGEIQSLPANMEAQLREAATSAGFELGTSGSAALTDFTAPGARDNTIVSTAGLFSRDILYGKRTLLEAFELIIAKAEHFTGKTWGDDIDPMKGPMKIVEFLMRDVLGPRGIPLPKGWDEGVTDDDRVKWGLTCFAATDERLNCQEIIAYLKAEVEQGGVVDNADKLGAVMTRVIQKMLVNHELTPVDVDQILRKMHEISGKRISIPALRRMMQQMNQGRIVGEDHTEIAVAVLADLKENGDIIFDEEILWQYNGAYWDRLEDVAVLNHIAIKYSKEKAAKRAADHSGILKIMKTLARGELVKIKTSGINFVNGFLGEDLKLIAHHPDHGMRYVMPYPYMSDRASQCPRWQKMLFDAWGRDPDYAEKLQVLGEALALTMFGRMTETQKVVCLYGVANSGKSQIMEIVQGLMPLEGQTSLPPQMWGDKFGPALMVGKVLNFAGELSEDQLIDSARFKQIVEGAMIDAQHKQGQLFNYRPKAAHWFSTNHFPKTRDSSSGFTRRWLFLTFMRAFPSVNEVADYYKVVLAEEREAIAAWAIQFMPGVMKREFKLIDPPSSAHCRELLENELNSVRDFLCSYRDQGKYRIGAQAHAEAKVPNGQDYVLLIKLYDEYRSFAVSQGSTPVGSKGFHKRMSHLQGQFGFEEEKIPGSGTMPLVGYRYISEMVTTGSRLKVAA